MIGQQAGKKTFLAIDTHSKTRVVVELVLFDPNSLKEAFQPPIDEPQAQFRRANASPDSTPAPEKQPYLNSFEVKTSVGTGFAMVKPYLEDTLPVNSKEKYVVEKHVAEPKDTVSLPSTTEPYQLNLSSPYRRHYTRTPQMSFRDFQIRATPDKLEIHCAQHRIRENLEEQYVSPLDELALGALTVISTVVLVGGSVAFSDSILLGILIAAALPIPLRLMAAQLPRVTNCKVTNRKAILRLTQESQGSKGFKSGSKHRALLSLRSCAKIT